MKNPRDLASRMIDLTPRMIRFLKGEAELAIQGRLTLVQFRILADIQKGTNTVGQIAQIHGVSQPAMSKTIEGLVRKGLIKRKASAEDRRQVPLQLTAKGLETYGLLRDSTVAGLGRKLADFSAGDRDQIQRALQKLEAVFEDIIQKNQKERS